MINIMYAGNDNVYDGILISCLSLTKYCDEQVNVIILTMDLTDKSPKFTPVSDEHARVVENVLRRVNGQSKVTVIDVGELYRETLIDSPNAQTGYTPYSFLRLLSDRLDQVPDKILYLDTDTVFERDVRELYDIDVSGVEYAGVLDYYGRWFLRYDYINSGVLLLNMKMIRQTGLFRRSVEKCNEKKIFLPDQTALNRCTSRKKILKPRFNDQKRSHKSTVIRHFSMTILWLPYFHTRNIKPWQVDLVHNVLNIHRHDDILNEYLKIKGGNENVQ